MDISEVRVKLVERAGERLRAFCSITFDNAFVIRDLKIIGGTNGSFVAMPSRKLADRCRNCGTKNHLRARFCNECGKRLNEGRAPRDGQGRAKLHADIAHPINAACRDLIQQAVMDAYQAEVERSKQPGYEPTRFDDLDEDFNDLARSPSRKPACSRDRVEEETDFAKAAEADAPKKIDDDEGDDRSASEVVSDYDSLIADLKQEAATRRGARHERRQAGSSFGEGASDDDRDADTSGDGNGDSVGQPENRKRRRGGRGRDRGRRGGPRREKDSQDYPAASETTVRDEPADEAAADEAPEEEPAPITETSSQQSDFGAGL